MRALLQRADGARVEVGGRPVGGFTGPGLVALVGVTHDDDAAAAARLADKIAGVRLFEVDRLAGSDICVAPGGPRERSVSDLGLPVLVVSQFTLYGQTAKGRRPTWDLAAARPVAEPLVTAVVDALRGRGIRVETGEFGADMRVHLVNDGPVTLLLEV